MNDNTPAGDTDGATANKPGLSFDTTTKCRPWAASSADPATIPEAHPAEYMPESAPTPTSPPATNDGASFTGKTVIVTVPVSVAVPSPTVYPNQSVPLQSAGGM